jgi:hypothetical protein
VARVYPGKGTGHAVRHFTVTKYSDARAADYVSTMRPQSDT